jgi:type IV pilus assembly protein PilV
MLIIRCRGMTLIEVLVSLVVISVGLLGVAALQVVSLRNSQGSYLRTQATALADDIIDRMRANRTAALNSQYNIAFGQTVTLPTTPTQAQIDLSQWKQALVTELPKTPTGGIADGRIVINGSVVTVTIRWGERGDRNQAATAIEFGTSTEI